jgi:hypothetical protein
VVEGEFWSVEYEGAGGVATFSLAEFERSRVGERLAPELWVAIVRAIQP